MDIVEINEIEKRLLITTGKMELYKKLSADKENEIQGYITKIEQYKIFEDPVTPEIAKRNRDTNVTLAIEQLKHDIEELSLFTPRDRKVTVQINTESFTPKVTSTKEIKTNLFENKFKNEPINEPQTRQSKNTISKFNGEGTPGTAFDSWIKVFEKNADYGKWNINRRIAELPIYLEKTAADFYDQLSNNV